MDLSPLGTGLATLTLVCGVLCGLLIVGIGVVYVLTRLELVRDLISAIFGALRGKDETLGDEGLLGDQGADRVRSRVRSRSSASQRVAEIRAKYDQEFQAGDAPASTGSAPAVDAYKQRYKRRFREESLDRDDELDAFIDDTEL
jgi:hypothetical protein